MMAPWSRLASGVAAAFLVFAALPALSDAQYVVEVLAVVDQPGIDTLISEVGAGSRERVIEEITAMFFEVNLLYQSYRVYGIDIEIRLKDILITEDDIMGEDIFFDEGGSVMADKDIMFPTFVKWLRDNVAHDWDHAMYLTTADIVADGSTTVVGTAYIDCICEDDGVSLVEMKFIYRAVRTIAHEISHSMNIAHDDLLGWPECEDMSDDETFIMWPYNVYGSTGRWFFSPCSALGLGNKLAELGQSSCLSKTSSEPIVSTRMGEFLTADQFCQREMSFTKGVYYLYDSGDDLCVALSCWDGLSLLYDSTSPEGLPCGDGRHCFMGNCI